MYLYMLLIVPTSSLWSLTVVHQTLHERHRPPPGKRHAESPTRLVAARKALTAAPFAGRIVWTRALDSERTPQDAVAALKLVHTVEHLRAVQGLSQSGGGGFDMDTYCAPGSWEAMLDGTRAWLHATALAAEARGPAVALSRPAGHHATASVAMGFGLVNFAAAATAALLTARPEARVSILDWDVHYGNGVADLLREEPRALYCSLHEFGGFPGGGEEEQQRGPRGNLLRLPLPRGSGREAFLSALRHKALPFLLARPPDVLLVCAGYDGLLADPLATMELSPADYGEAVRAVLDEHGFPAERVAIGLEGGYALDLEEGMPAALVETCGALIARGRRGGGETDTGSDGTGLGMGDSVRECERTRDSAAS